MNLFQLGEAAARRLSLPLKWARKELQILRIRRAESLVVGLGGALQAGKLVHGGAVKLLEFRKALPVDDESFSILYLVSSALPDFAFSLVKACQRKKIPVVWNQNGVAYPAWAGKRTEALNAPMRRLHSLADFVVYQSGFCERSAQKWLGLPNAESTTLFNPVDLEFFSPPKEPATLRPLRLLAMGTHHFPQRVLSVIEALGILRKEGIEANLTIAGRLLWENGQQEVLRAIRTWGLEKQVTLVSTFDRHGARALCQSHHLLLHPKPMDPCPTVVAEALACGLPVIASATGGLPEMADAQCAYLVPGPEDWEELHTPDGKHLATGVSILLERWEAASHAARARAQKVFDARHWLNEHCRIFRNLLHLPTAESQPT